MISEPQLVAWTRPASETEATQRERTERAVRRALDNHPTLAGQPLKVYAKGSYANNTNVRQDSDVDIVVEYTGGFYYDAAGEVDVARLGISDYSGPFPDFSDFKAAVQSALSRAFGSGTVARHNKCITVAKGATPLPADVVPCWTHRWYYSQTSYEPGTAFFADDRPHRCIENYPQQHYDKGVAKNNRTSRRYKRTVRILKRLENDMVDKGLIDEVPSYLIECLVYNCPDGEPDRDSWRL